VLFAAEELDAAPTGVVEETCFRQIEFAGVLAGTDAPDAARALVDFLISERFQREVPMNLFVFPANETVELDPAFVEYAAIPDDLAVARPGRDRRQPRRPGSTSGRRSPPADTPEGVRPSPGSSDTPEGVRPSPSSIGSTAPRHTRRGSDPLLERVAAVVRRGRGGAAGGVPRTVFYVWPFVTSPPRGVRLDAIGDTFGRSRTWEVLWFTTWQAVASTLLTLVIGLAPAWAVSRFSFPGRTALISVLTAVFVLPTVVVGAAFVALLPDSLDRSIWAILGAHVVFNLAVVVRTVGAVWEQLPADLDHAAATLGASPWRGSGTSRCRCCGRRSQPRRRSCSCSRSRRTA
jgi:ABC-type glycerol-3-phosphate transport system permease component